MKCVVIGLGHLGTPVARALGARGFEVIAIDREHTRVEEIKDAVSLAVQLDATDADALRAQGVGGADVLVATISGNFETQTLAVVYARQLEVRRIIAHAVSPMHAQILQLIGAHEILRPEEESAHGLAQRLALPTLRAYLELAEGFSVAEVTAPARAVGQTFRELDLLVRFRINLIGVRRGEGDDDARVERFDPIPDPEDQVRADDVLALVGRDADVKRFTEAYAVS